MSIARKALKDRAADDKRQHECAQLELLKKLHECCDRGEFDDMLSKDEIKNLDWGLKFQIERENREEPYYGTLLHGVVLSDKDWKIWKIFAQVRKRGIKEDSEEEDDESDVEDKKRRQTEEGGGEGGEGGEGGGKRAKKGGDDLMMTTEGEEGEGGERGGKRAKKGGNEENQDLMITTTEGEGGKQQEENNSTTATTGKKKRSNEEDEKVTVAKIARKDDINNAAEITPLSLILICDSDGQTPAQIAALLGHSFYCLWRGGETEEDQNTLLLPRDHDGRTFLHRAAASQDCKMMKALQHVNFWILIDKKDNNGDTPLLLAAKNENEDVFLHLWKKMDRDRVKKKQAVLGVDENGKSMVDYCNDDNNNKKGIISAAAIATITAYSESLNRSKELIDAVKALDVDRFRQILEECKSDELRIAMLVNLVDDDQKQEGEKTVLEALIQKYSYLANAEEENQRIVAMLRVMKIDFKINFFSMSIPLPSPVKSTEITPTISFVHLMIRMNKVGLLRSFVSTLPVEEQKEFVNTYDLMNRTLIHMAILEDTPEWDENSETWKRPGYCKLNPDDFDFIFTHFDLGFTETEADSGLTVFVQAFVRHSRFYNKIFEKCVGEKLEEKMMNPLYDAEQSILFHLSTADEVIDFFASDRNLLLSSFFAKSEEKEGTSTIFHKAIQQGRDSAFFSAIFDAVKNFNNSDSFKKELVWTKDTEGLSAMDFAFKFQNFAIFSSILRDRALMADGKVSEIIQTRVNAKNGRCILHQIAAATAKEQDAAARALLSFNRLLAFRLDKNGQTPLHVAALNNNYKIFKAILDYCDTEDDKLKLMWMEDRRGSTAISAILQSCDLKMMECIFQEEYLMNNSRFANVLRWRVDNQGQSILHRALAQNSNNNYIEVIRRIVSLDDSLAFMQDEEGKTPLHRVVESQGSIATMAAIVHGCPTEDDKKRLVLTADNAGDTVIEYAMRQGNVNAISFFLKLKCLRKENKITDILGATVDSNGQTILHRAVAGGNRDALRTIMSFNSSLAFIQDKQGKSPLHLAVEVSCFVDRHPFDYPQVQQCDGDAFCSLLCSCKTKDEKRKLFWMRDLNGEVVLDLAIRLSKSGVLYRILRDKCLTGDGRVGEILRRSIDEKGQTVMHRAALSDIDLFDCILSLGVDMCFIRDADGRTPLHMACAQDESRLRGILLLTLERFSSAEEAMRLLSMPDNQGISIVNYVVRSDSLATLQSLLQCSQFEKHHTFLQNVCNCVDNDGKTVLHRAVSKNNSDIIPWIVSKWRKVCFIQDKTGKTPLHEAAERGRKDNSFWQILEAFGEEEEKRRLLWVADHQGETAIHYAFKNDHFGIVTRLYSSCAWALDVRIVKLFESAVDENGQTLLHRAAAKSQFDLVRLMLSFIQSLVFIQDEQGRTPLHVAAQHDRNVFDLILSGCNTKDDKRKVLWMEDQNGETAVHLAVSCANAHVVCSILRRVNTEQEIHRLQHILRTTVDKNGQTIAHRIAAQRKKSAALEELLAFDSSLISILDKQGMNLLHVAAVCEKNMISSILRRCRTDDERKKLMLTEDVNGKTAIHYAVTHADPEIVFFTLGQTFFAQDERVAEILRTTIDESKQTILHRFAKEENNYIPILGLMKFDCNLAFAPDQDQETALHIAARHSSTSFCAILEGCKTEEQKQKLAWTVDYFGRTVLYYAVSWRNLGTIERFLQEECLAKDPRVAEILREDGDESSTVLHCAVLKGYPALSRRIVSLDSSIAFLKDPKSKTALHLAVDAEEGNLFDAILDGIGTEEEKARLIWMTDGDGQTVIHLAVSSIKLWPILSLLRCEFLNEDAKFVEIIRTPRKGGQTFLHQAAAESNLEVITRLLSVDSSLAFIQDDSGKTPLIVAKRGEFLSPAIIAILTALKTDEERIKLLWIADNSGKTVIHHVLESRSSIRNVIYPECCLTKERVADILRTVVDRNGQTILHRTVVSFRHQLIDWLLSGNSIIFAVKDNEGYAALHRAIQEPREFIFPESLLLDKENRPRMDIDPNIRIGISDPYY